MYICTHINAHLGIVKVSHMYGSTCAYVHVCMCTYVSVRMHLCLYLCMHVRMHVYSVYISRHIYIHVTRHRDVSV